MDTLLFNTMLGRLCWLYEDGGGQKIMEVTPMQTHVSLPGKLAYQLSRGLTMGECNSSWRNICTTEVSINGFDVLKKSQ